MTYTTYDVEQGSTEWHDLRRGILTASTIGQLITAKTLKVAANDKSRALVNELVAERITGWTEDSYTSDDMWRGHDDEPIAVKAYADHYDANVSTVGLMVRELGNGRIAYSPDALVDEDGLVEVKSAKPKIHLATILADAVPAHHMAQCQAGLFVSGRKWLDFVSFSGGLPLWLKRVYPDPLWQEAIFEAVTSFEQSAAQMVAAYQEATKGLAQTERVVREMEMVI